MHIVDLWQYYASCTRPGVTRCTRSILLFLCLMYRCGLHAVLWSLAHRFTYAPPRCRTSQYLCGTILVTPCLMVWDWLVSRAGPMPFYRPCCSFLFCLLQFSISLLSFYGFVLWGCGPRFDSVRSLPALHYKPFLMIIILINNNKKRNKSMGKIKKDRKILRPIAT